MAPHRTAYTGGRRGEGIQRNPKQNVGQGRASLERSSEFKNLPVLLDDLRGPFSDSCVAESMSDKKKKSSGMGWIASCWELYQICEGGSKGCVGANPRGRRANNGHGGVTWCFGWLLRCDAALGGEWSCTWKHISVKLVSPALYPARDTKDTTTHLLPGSGRRAQRGRGPGPPGERRKGMEH